MMRMCVVFGALLLMIVSSCKQDGQSLSDVKPDANGYYPLGVVPEWVRAYVTQEEYDLYKIVSTKHRMNYDGVKKKLSPEAKERSMQMLRKVAEGLRNGGGSQYVHEEGSITRFKPPLVIDDLPSENKENLEVGA